MRAAAVLFLLLALRATAIADECPERAPRLGLDGIFEGGRDEEEMWEELLPTCEGPPTLTRVRVGVVVLRGGATLFEGDLLAAPGRRAVFSRTKVHAVVRDYDVELACDNSGGFFPCVIGDPIVRELLSGIALEVRPSLVDGGKRVAMKALAQAGELTVGNFMIGAKYLGELDIPKYRGVTVLVSGSVDAGTPFTARAGPYEIRLTPVVERGPGEEKPDRSLLTGAWTRPIGEYEDEIHPEWLRAARAARLGEAGPVMDGREDIDRFVSGIEETCARTVVLDLTLRDGEQIVSRLTLPALSGRDAMARLGVDRTVVADDDVEVGCYVAIADPIVRRLFEGILVRARPSVAPDGRSIRLTLHVGGNRLPEAPERRPVGDEVNGAIHRVTLEGPQADFDVVLEPGRLLRLHLGGRWTIEVAGRLR